MSDFISLNLEGGKELERKLLGLERKVAKKIVRKAVREGLKPTLAAAKSNAKTMMGGKSKTKNDDSMRRLLTRNIVLRAAKKQRKGSYLMRVQTRPNIEKFVHTAADGTRYYIPAAIEYGHDSAPAIPFMRAAADANLAKGKTIVANELKRGIEAIARGS